MGQPKRRRQEFSGFIDGRGGGGAQGNDFFLLDPMSSGEFNSGGYYNNRRRGVGYNSMDSDDLYGPAVPAGPPEPKYVNGKRVLVNSEIQ